MRTITARTFTKIYISEGRKHRIVVTAELHSIGDQEPYFSITGDIHWQAANNRWVFVAGGCIHDEIIEHFPELEPLVAIHLSNQDGVPLHAYENAAYWAGATKWQERNIGSLAKHLRINEKVAAHMCEWVDNFYGTDFDVITPTSEAWATACEEFGLLTEWKNDAETAKQILETNLLSKEVN